MLLLTVGSDEGVGTANTEDVDETTVGACLFFSTTSLAVVTTAYSNSRDMRYFIVTP
jgi:hypothetical protein